MSLWTPLNSCSEEQHDEQHDDEDEADDDSSLAESSPSDACCTIPLHPVTLLRALGMLSPAWVWEVCALPRNGIRKLGSLRDGLTVTWVWTTSLWVSGVLSSGMFESLCRLKMGFWCPWILCVELPTVPVVLSSVLGLPFPNTGKFALKSIVILDGLFWLALFTNFSSLEVVATMSSLPCISTMTVLPSGILSRSSSLELANELGHGLAPSEASSNESTSGTSEYGPKDCISSMCSSIISPLGADPNPLSSLLSTLPSLWGKAFPLCKERGELSEDALGRFALQLLEVLLVRRGEESTLRDADTSLNCPLSSNPASLGWSEHRLLLRHSLDPEVNPSNESGLIWGDTTPCEFLLQCLMRTPLRSPSSELSLFTAPGILRWSTSSTDSWLLAVLVFLRTLPWRNVLLSSGVRERTLLHTVSQSVMQLLQGDRRQMASSWQCESKELKGWSLADSWLSSRSMSSHDSSELQSALSRRWSSSSDKVCKSSL